MPRETEDQDRPQSGVEQEPLLRGHREEAAACPAMVVGVGGAREKASL